MSNDHPKGLRLEVDKEALRPMVEEIVREALNQYLANQKALPDKLAFSEEEAARLLGLNPWQLRDERLRGRISASGIVGRRIRYTRQDLIDYLSARRLGR
jgi:hypothetical protein